MNSERGSEWRKWDFHVHTPYSVLNNQFGLNADGKEDFDQYVKQLFETAVKKDIAAIGITDYFLPEGYKAIKTKYLSNESKMKELFPDDTLRGKVEDIFIFPNIEFRLGTFVGERSHSVNYHVLFSDEVSLEDIENDFLSKLSFKFSDDTKKVLNRRNIEELGRKEKALNKKTGDDFKVGLEVVTVSDDCIREALESSSVFKGKHLIAVPVDEDLSHIKWEGRDALTRRSLYRQSDCYMTANAKTREWALAVGSETERIAEFGSIKPCIWGSDAHSFERLFEPAESKYCWVKADTTFEGLLQILCEPSDRVYIGKSRPCEKDPSQVIDHVVFSDEDFQTNPVYFNESLTCIIGGKSTGKSTLLRRLANAASPEYAKTQEQIARLLSLGQKGDTKVVWKDRGEGERKIIYIPQTYLNRVMDYSGDNASDDNAGVSSIVEEVLHQREDIRKKYNQMKDSIERITSDLRKAAGEFHELRNMLYSMRQQVSEEGTSKSFADSLLHLEKEQIEVAGELDVRQGDIDRYIEVKSLIPRTRYELAQIQSDMSFMERIGEPIAIHPRYVSLEKGFASRSYSGLSELSAGLIEQSMEKITQELRPYWGKESLSIKLALENKEKELRETLQSLKKELNELQPKIDQSEKLDKITRLIATTRQKLRDATETEDKISKTESRMRRLASIITECPKLYRKAIDAYCDCIAELSTSLDTELKFSAQIEWDKAGYSDAVDVRLDRRNYSSFSTEYGVNLADIDADCYEDKFPKDLFKAIACRKKAGSVDLKNNFRLDEVLSSLFGNWYRVRYRVESAGDALEEMSPGKKSLVLLEMIICLEAGTCPILVDQPEDDLDNRSIYKELVEFVRNKKKERQIIFVTHNANVVLGADAEEIIVANQDGNDAKNKSARFEYRSGAIENDQPVLNEKGVVEGILNRTGIQQHMCDILEGGEQAFERRWRKLTVMHL